MGGASDLGLLVPQKNLQAHFHGAVIVGQGFHRPEVLADIDGRQSFHDFHHFQQFFGDGEAPAEQINGFHGYCPWPEALKLLQQGVLVGCGQIFPGSRTLAEVGTSRSLT